MSRMVSTDSRQQIHQFVAVLDRSDAVGNHALAIRDLLRQKGYQSEIFAWHAGEDMQRRCRDYLEYHGWSASRNIIIYHFGASSPVTELFLKLPDRKVIIYHNITPAEFFKGVNTEVYYIMKNGRRELERLSGKVDLAIADSEYNREELTRLGFENTVTVPLLIDFSRYDAAPESSIMTKYGDGSANIIFVGRVGPNKKQEDVIRAFSIYKKYIHGESRLFIVGPSRQVPEYNVLLNRLVDSLGVEGVHITGEASQAELNAYYSIADVFLSMSEHEGFCIPLIECMYFRVPVLAYESSAVAGTLNGSGVLFTRKDLGRVAEMIDMIVKDKDMKERIVDAQKKRLEFFRRERVEEQFLNSLAGLLN